MRQADRKVEPRSVISVANRALALAALVCRGSIESGAGHSEAESLHGRIRNWVARCGLDEEFQAGEAELVRTPLGQLDATTVNSVTWEVEGLAILVWALGLCDLPKHDEKVDPYDVTDRIWFLNDDATQMIGGAEFRSVAELSAYRELIYAIHCRIDNFSRERTKKDFRAWIETSWLDTLGLDVDLLIVNDDLAIQGAEISHVDAQLVENCKWLTLPRHRASIWLLGNGTPYSRTPVST